MKEVWNFSWRQQIIDEDEELFVGNESISQKEDCAQVLEAASQIYSG